MFGYKNNFQQYDKIDPEIQELVRYVNERGGGQLWTVHSCQGHENVPGKPAFPILSIDCKTQFYLWAYDHIHAKIIVPGIRVPGIGSGLDFMKHFILHPFYITLPTITTYRWWRDLVSVGIAISISPEAQEYSSLNEMQRMHSGFVRELVDGMIKMAENKRVTNLLFR